MFINVDFLSKPMRTSKVFSVISLILFLVSSVVINSYSQTAYACSCMQPLSPNEEMSNYDVVFSGKVIDVKDVNLDSPSRSSADPILITIEVYNVWKGDKNEEITVKTALTSASCGFPFVENEEYIVYATTADDNGKILEVNSCSRTGLLADAVEELDKLGTGHSINPEIKSKMLSPLKQLKSGISAEDIKCNDGLYRALKHDNTPVCVSKHAAIKLAERGWLSSNP